MKIIKNNDISRNSGVATKLCKINTKLGYFSPVILMFTIILNISADTRIKLLAFLVLLCLMLPILPKEYIPIQNKNKRNAFDYKYTFLDNDLYRPFVNLKNIIIFLISIAVLIFLASYINSNKSNFIFTSTFFTSAKNAFSAFLKNDYVVNIICTIITAFVMYHLQIKYSKSKIKKIFRCNEIIWDLYSSIESTLELCEKANYLKKELDKINEPDDFKKEEIKSKKYLSFYKENYAAFNLNNKSLTYHNNEILIDSINSVFFINLNFKLLNIVNNIKNRIPNLLNLYPDIELTYKKYSQDKNKKDLLILGNKIERNISDMKFLATYYYRLLKYLEFNPIPIKIRIAILNHFYPNNQLYLNYFKLSPSERKTVDKKIDRIARKEYLKYTIKRFFGI